LIASQDSVFNLEYQIDKKPPVTSTMRTFKDSKRRGYTEAQARRIIDDLLTGKAIFIRVNTLIRKVLSAELPLENAAAPINQVMTDCGLGSTENATDNSVYTLNEFEKEFNKLPSDQQQQLLNKLKKIIIETQKVHSSEK
jgi:AraC-like DNA-binding protein